jgi:phosphoglycolate phosphatase
MGHEPWSLQTVRDSVRHSMRDSFPALFGDRWEEAADIFYQAFERRHLEALMPLGGAEELLQTLASMDVDMGVVSNKTGRFLRKEVAHLGWERYFGALVGAGDAAQDKPAVDAVAHALGAMKLDDVRLDRALWFVGDSNVDMEIAHRVGCLPVLIRPDHGPDGEFATHGPHLHLPDCGALSDLVFRL